VDHAVKVGAERHDAASVQIDHAVLDAVTGAISRLRFGTVLVTVHDGKVVQIDTTERRRFS
jgi:hypothetical protein